MTPDPRFTFSADTTTGTIDMRRDFAAPLSRVWSCYTQADLLDRWYAPKPLTTRTAHMDFREGGHWHFAMITPEGTEYWSRFDFRSIEPTSRFAYLDGFSDAEGNVAQDLPRAEADTRFAGADGRTTVRSTIRYASAEDLQKVIDMGMEAGIASTLDRLDELLVELSR